MIIVIFLVCVGVILLGVWLCHEWDCAITGGVTMACGIIGSIISFIALIILLIDVSGLKAIDTKIEMYQTENSNIESQIAECIKGYQKYETEIFTEVAPDNAMTLVTLYPELKSDELVKKQIEVYVANNEKIKELKEQKIMGDVYRWWVYFGG
jgi:TRAP-type mannitol/chloroaromatic compound transport system permease large subunit